MGVFFLAFGATLICIAWGNKSLELVVEAQ
jgi:hypothetical protein